MYFLTARKCALFGVTCEAIPRQVNFLCEEAGSSAKGANLVISQLHFFFQHHGLGKDKLFDTCTRVINKQYMYYLGEKTVYLHADNCTGQNKKNTMIQYLMWTAMTSWHTNITPSFLVVGHTKFAPDWCFGLIKRLYRRTAVSMTFVR